MFSRERRRLALCCGALAATDFELQLFDTSTSVSAFSFLARHGGTSRAIALATAGALRA